MNAEDNPGQRIPVGVGILSWSLHPLKATPWAWSTSWTKLVQGSSSVVDWRQKEVQIARLFHEFSRRLRATRVVKTKKKGLRGQLKNFQWRIFKHLTSKGHHFHSPTIHSLVIFRPGCHLNWRRYTYRPVARLSLRIDWRLVFSQNVGLAASWGTTICLSKS